MFGLPDQIRACLFDLDGVLTDTASVHKRAWKAMFDEFLRQRDGDDFTPFDAGSDYDDYVDGKPRGDGVRSFLQSRHIDVDDDCVRALGDKKNTAFQQTLEKDGVEVFDGSRRYLQAVAEAGLRRAVVSSSANTEQVLQITGLAQYVEVRVDGVTLREEHLPGKPAPDSFLRAAELLGVSPAEAAVFEDAQSGVAAGRAGHFGVVIGVDRVGQADELREHGADTVVTDLEELLDR
ncbi:beta-phosphoglucomutase family hydrolase [Mycobacterium sp. PSTR-4-N]|uniref:beta-phosphoglucomutase family hydrolase n=1 Tax=Mycobacterium sp. PSTR-4-N TaxID=2917745 RepID=UPI001F1510A8|nr:beta-phosphoglucomutase family hydrolase [Mycobacterium sp. PSTR-4-N]MCG7596776.1 beta-phosphoglucomutase family hydrolase [Mycobacterium sp. PSTR-4-N]